MDERLSRARAKETGVQEIERELLKHSVTPDQLNNFLKSKGSAPLKQGVKLHSLLLRPEVSLSELAETVPAFGEFLATYDAETRQLAQTQVKYEGYIQREQDMVNKMNRLEGIKLAENFDYASITSLSHEARQKLSELQPRTIGQASRISGVSPADVSVLLVHMGR